MDQIVITPVTGRLGEAMTEAFRLYVARHADLFGEEFPVRTVNNTINITLIRGMSEQELKDVTVFLTAAGNINAVHLEKVHREPEEELIF